MVRPCDQLIEIAPLPEGIQVRPVQPEQWRQLWDAAQEAFQDHWGFVPAGEEAYKEWLASPDFRPELFMVAWDGDEVVGQIQNAISENENKEYNRLRGYTEDISVRRPWRRQGVARALLTRSIKMFQEMGMDETELGVDTQNPNGAKGLYAGVGYQELKRFTTYRKLLYQGSSQ
jgi:ribosomal protein S18 acetylase RimI-like enzyme